MTREERENAIRCLKLWIEREPYIQTYKTCLEALEQGPAYCDRNICIKNEYNGIGCEECEVTKSQEPCEDCISRVELLKAIDTWDKFGFEHTGCFVREPKDDFITYVHYDDVIKCIKGMPSVQPKPKTGQFAKWVATEIFDDNWEYNKDAFAEIACRKLAKLGIVRAKGDEWELVEPQEISDHKCHNCKHYTSGERDGSCGSYICKHYSNWESEG